MRRRAAIWGFHALLYLGFLAWYTDWRGPLAPDEIERFAAAVEAQGFGAERLADLRAFMEQDTGRPFLMLNALDLADDPPDVAGAARDESAEQLLGRYMEYMLPELLRRACHPVVAGDAVFRALDVVGVDGADEWTTGALMRYRSRRSLMEIVANPVMRERHDFKLAALDKTIAYPIETQLNLGDARLLVGLLLLAGAALTDLAFGRPGA